jgi:chromosome segregation ATPase
VVPARVESCFYGSRLSDSAMTSEIITNIIVPLIAIISNIVTYYFTRKKTAAGVEQRLAEAAKVRADAAITNADAANRLSHMNADFTESLLARMNALDNKNADLQSQIESLRKALVEKESRILDLERHVATVERERDSLRQRVTDLEAQIKSIFLDNNNV